MKQNFIKTSDSETASKMINLGFQKIDEQNGIYTFLNTDKLMFSDDIDKSKIQYSNMLNFYFCLNFEERRRKWLRKDFVI